MKKMSRRKLKVALVHDYLKEFGGAERVLEVLHEMWPEAPIYTAFAMPEKWGPHRERLEKWDIRTTWIEKLPFKDYLTSHYSIFGPLAFESLDLREYDLVVNSTNPYISKSIVTHPHQVHIAYVHTPPKAPWGFAGANPARKKKWWKPIVALGDHYLRQVDFLAAQRPDVLVANSENVAARIRKFYRRECEVIYPPIDFRITNYESRIMNKNEKYYLMVGRLAGGRDLEVPILAALKGGFDLKIVGKGMGKRAAERELKQLESRITNHELRGKVEFLGEVSDEELAGLYAGAEAYIDPRPNEDFGMTPVEAMACGTPVIVRDSGGLRESVVPGKTGMLFDAPAGASLCGQDAYREALTEALIEAVRGMEKLEISAKACVKRANEFSRERFEVEMRAVVSRAVNEFQSFKVSKFLSKL